MPLQLTSDLFGFLLYRNVKVYTSRYHVVLYQTQDKTLTCLVLRQQKLILTLFQAKTRIVDKQNSTISIHCTNISSIIVSVIMIGSSSSGGSATSCRLQVRRCILRQRPRCVRIIPSHCSRTAAAAASQSLMPSTAVVSLGEHGALLIGHRELQAPQTREVATCTCRTTVSQIGLGVNLRLLWLQCAPIDFDNFHCVTVPNFVAIGQTIVNIWQFVAIFKMAAVCHVGFYKFEILSTDRV